MVRSFSDDGGRVRVGSLLQEMLGIPGCEIQQSPSGPAAGFQDSDPSLPPLGEKGFEEMPVGSVGGNENLRGNVVAPQKESLQGRVHYCLGSLRIHVVHESDFPAQQVSVPHAQKNRAGPGILDGDAQDIAVAATEVHRRLSSLEDLEPSDHVPELRGDLELQRVGGLPHLRAKFALQLAGIPRENRHHLVDLGSIGLEGLKTYARGEATIDVIVETGAIRSPGGQLEVARTNVMATTDESQRPAHRAHARERTEVSRSIGLEGARDQDPWVALRDGDFHVREALVIAQLDIEARAVLLDQVGFQQQRFRLGAGEEAFHGRDPRYQPGQLQRIGCIPAEVASYSISE